MPFYSKPKNELLPTKKRPNKRIKLTVVTRLLSQDFE
jgi:hypothetical protein